MTAFKSGVLDHNEVATRREELFGPSQGTKNGVDTTKRPDPPRFEPGHYPGCDDRGFSAVMDPRFNEMPPGSC